MAKRSCWYVKWYKSGREKLYSTGEKDERAARKKFNDFMESRRDIHPLARVFSLPIDDLGGARIRMSRKSDTVYFIGGEVGAIKIGMAIDVQKRLKSLQIGSPIKLQLFATAPGGRGAEQAYHRRFAEHRLHGEWFNRHSDILAEIDRLVAVAEAGGEEVVPDLFGAAA